MNYRFFLITIVIGIKAKISGVVTEIQIFNTILLTPGNKTVIPANGAFSNGTIVNYSRLGNLRVDITTPAAPDSDVIKAEWSLWLSGLLPHRDIIGMHSFRFKKKSR